jgi:hypothetical protein
MTSSKSSHTHRSSVQALNNAIKSAFSHKSEAVTFESQQAAGKNVVKLSEKPPGPTPELLE